MQDERHSQEDLVVAAVGYIPFFWLFLFLFHRWRSNYYTRYHLIHAAMLTLTQFSLLILTGLVTFWSAGLTGYNFVLVLFTGGLIAGTVVLGFGMTAYCALSAARGRYTVLPGLTRLYYLFFTQRVVQAHDNYDSRRITQMRPYLKPLPGEAQPKPRDP